MQTSIWTSKGGLPAEMAAADKLWRLKPLKKPPATTRTTVLFFSILVVTAVFTCSYWIDSLSINAINIPTGIVEQEPAIKETSKNVQSGFVESKPVIKEVEKILVGTGIPSDGSYVDGTENSAKDQQHKEIPTRTEFPLNCSHGNATTQTCASSYYPAVQDYMDSSNNLTCPEYFRWIHEDLRPFRATGITREMVEKAKKLAHFRLVIVQGKVYVEKYKKSIQTRDLFTIWGILQLLRRYPGKLPDLELMFDCDDRPVVRARDYRGRRGSNATAVQPAASPPPLFRYCGDKWTLDIVFPDWSFWGWAEINIKPWESVLKEMREGNAKTKWMERPPYAYWKGNPFVADTRKDLLTCNVSDKHDWNARLFVQDWIQEGQNGFKQSNVADQCNYRYKIYIEGYAWSVSEKYILACNSPTLVVKPQFYDFFMRGLQPVQHYWPIKNNDKCRSIKFAVDWGNNHKRKAQEIGKAASDFIQEDLKMDYVYDYMFHLLNEYAKLLRFKPKVPKGATEMCSETMACQRDGNEKKFMMESLVKSPSLTIPCSLPPPYEPLALGAIVRRKINAMKQVEKWEQGYWKSLPKQQ